MLAELEKNISSLCEKEVITFIPDEICRLLGHSNNIVHASLAHASGLFTLENKKLKAFGLDRFDWPEASTDDLVEIGHIKLDGHSIPCFGGYGDLQASVAGISPNKQHWIVNLGTGSQIISFIDPVVESFELRRYFQEKSLYCISHIPAGRALNVWAKFFQQVRDDATQSYFWNMLQSSDLRDLSSDLPTMNLAVFQEAFGYEDGGNVANIQEDHFSPKIFFSGMLHSFLGQYIKILADIDLNKERPISIAGKMATELPIIKEFFDKN